MKNMVSPVHKDRQKLRLDTLLGYGIISWTKPFWALPNWCSIILETQAAFYPETTKKISHFAKWCMFYLYHSNLECIWFVTRARGCKAPEGKCDKSDTLQIAMIWTACTLFTGHILFLIGCTFIKAWNMCAFHLPYGTVEHRYHQFRTVQPLK